MLQRTLSTGPEMAAMGNLELAKPSACKFIVQKFSFAAVAFADARGQIRLPEWAFIYSALCVCVFLL